MEKTKTKKVAYSILKWIGWVLLVQFILINLSAALYADRLTRYYDDPELKEYKPSSNIFAKTWKLFTGPKQARSAVTETPSFSYEKYLLSLENDKKIETWYAKADSNAKGTVLMFHGIGGNKGMLLDEADEFLYMGYNILLVDFRGHGNSQGNNTTIGFRETEEVRQAFEFISSKGEKNIFLWGGSMGAVVIIKAIAEYGLQPNGILLEMPFESLQAHLKARARILGFPQQPFAFFTTFWIGVEKGFNGFKYRTTAYAKKVKCPVLLQWGMLDAYVLHSETERIYEKLASTDKKLVIYNEAAHESLLRKNPMKWKIETEKFLNDHL